MIKLHFGWQLNSVLRVFSDVKVNPEREKKKQNKKKKARFNLLVAALL